MDKRALSAIPRPTLTDKNREMQQLVQNMSYLVTASRQEIAGIDTLIVNFFQAGKDGLKPQFRTFCQMDDYISQDLTTDKTKWKTGAINSLAGYLYWHANRVIIVIASTGERKEILTFFQEYRKRYGIADLVQDIAIDSEVSDSELRETQTANYFSDIYPIDSAVLSANAQSSPKCCTLLSVLFSV